MPAAESADYDLEAKLFRNGRDPGAQAILRIAPSDSLEFEFEIERVREHGGSRAREDDFSTALEWLQPHGGSGPFAGFGIAFGAGRDRDSSLSASLSKTRTRSLVLALGWGFGPGRSLKAKAGPLQERTPSGWRGGTAFDLEARYALSDQAGLRLKFEHDEDGTARILTLAYKLRPGLKLTADAGRDGSDTRGGIGVQWTC